MDTRDLSAHVPYEAGRGIEEVARELGRDPDDLLKLASNENPHGPAAAAVDAVREHAGRVNRYPTAAHTDLREAVADRWDVAAGQVWLGPGADGAIDYLSRAALAPGESVLVPEPGFAYYGMSARYHHGGVATYSLTPPTFEQSADAVLDAYDGERMVFLTSPHSPAGTAFDLDDVARVAAMTDKRTLVVVDEAYGEYAPRSSAAPFVGGRSRHLPPERDPFDVATPVVERRDDVVVLRTFSKAYGLAGLRVGYALVPDEWADAYAAINTPFAVNELACRAALAAVDDPAHVQRSVETAVEARVEMRERVEAPVVGSEANFVLVEVGDAAAVAAATKRRGVIVRECSSFGLPGHVRVTCGTPEETDRAVAALNEALREVESRV
ncbi:histidinol-phosphate transaminase [Halobacteriales archaeon SW_5_70_135]|nr:MAG: histidinol-phosphate transaminase [Halobacteriales archaeon SW_5_70_135]